MILPFEAFISSISISEEVAIASIPMASIAICTLAATVYALQLSNWREERLESTERYEAVMKIHDVQLSNCWGEERLESTERYESLMKRNDEERLESTERYEAVMKIHDVQLSNWGEERLESTERYESLMKINDEERLESTERYEALMKIHDVQLSNWREERLERMERCEALESNLAATLADLKLAITDITKLDLRELFISLRNETVVDLNEQLPEGVSKKLTFRGHANYIDQDGQEYTGGGGICKCVDNLSKSFTDTGNKVAHSDRLKTQESRDGALKEALKVIEKTKISPIPKIAYGR